MSESQQRLLFVYEDQLSQRFRSAKDPLYNPKELGGDIFIHGKAVTIGCIPVGDPAIEELFLLVGKAMEREVKVIISPRDFRVNPEFPEIEGIDWETGLYENVRRELVKLNGNK